MPSRPIADHHVSRRAAMFGALMLAAGAGPASASLIVWPTQRNWRVCERCRLVSFFGFPANGRDAAGQLTHGRCAAGGGHSGGSLRLELQYNGDTNGVALPGNAAEDGRHQVNWRHCHKCRVLFYDGSSRKGVCPAGGGHEAAGFYFMARLADAQNVRFRFCGKCYGMFYIASGGGDRCPAGGTHHADGYLFDL